MFGDTIASSVKKQKMFKSVKLQTSSCSTLRGVFEEEMISEERIAELSGSWMNPPGTVCKRGSSTVAYIVDNMFVKCSPAGAFLRAVRKAFTVSRSMRSLKMSVALNAIGIPTPKVYCAVRESNFLLPVCDYLVTEKTDDRIITFGNNCPTEKWEQFFSSVCRLLNKMHCANICHGDASVRNFYIIDKKDGNFDIGVIDLDACKKVFLPFRRNTFIKEDARFISSFIISAELAETTESVSEICNKYLDSGISDYYTRQSHRNLLIKYTVAYLGKTKRYPKQGF